MNIVEYTRVGRVRAIIYVRGKDEGIQEMMCKLYAEDKGYDAVDVVKDLGGVNNCDVLLVSHASRISRNYIEYLQIENMLKNKAITIETALRVGKDIRYLDILKSL